MKKYFYMVTFLSIFWISGPFCSQIAFAQETLYKEQPAWDGVPEYYKEWSYPDYKFPSELSTWKNERLKVSETLQHLLGDIPARPKQLKVQIVYKKQMNGYSMEKFLIDNGLYGGNGFSIN